MNKNVVINYIKDKFLSSLIFLFTSGVIILYNYLKFGDSSVLLYTVILLLFMFAIYHFFEFVKYYKFNCQMEVIDNDSLYNLSPVTCEQKSFQKRLNIIEDNCIKKINRIELQERERQYFLSNWIHSMKTPVSAISLILEKYQEDIECRERFINDIKEETDALYQELEKVLSLLRLDDFSKDYVPGEVDLLQSVNNVINSRKNSFIYSRIYPEIAPDFTGIKVLTDRKWNEFMISQIVSNAIKYSKADGEDKKIEFSVQKKEDEVILTIRDFGIGIPGYDMSRIFQPFFTGENGRGVKNSSGIGLYMVKLISERLCHRIDVDSHVNEGTSFRITYLSKMQ